MKRIVLLVVLVVFAAWSAYAHGKEEHVMGTATAVTASTITVQTRDKDPVIVYTTAETKYENSGAAASMQDLQVGDRVVIHAAKIEDKLVANEVHFGAATHAPASH
jgi:Domain of unknown function (DUF5666)